MDKKKQEQLRQKVNKDRQQVRKRKAKLEELELNAEDIKIAENFGISIDKNVPPNPYEEEQEILLDSQAVLMKPEKGKAGMNRYSLEAKVMAIMFMEAMQDEDTDTGELKPKFDFIGKYMLPIAPNTLRSWWRKKDLILAQPTNVMDRVGTAVALQNANALVRMSTALNGADFDKLLKENPKVFTYMYNTLANKFRLFGNFSTENVAHAHKGSVQLVTPDDKPK